MPNDRITQHEWTMVLISTWRANYSLFKALAIVNGELPTRTVGTTRLKELIDSVSHLYPPVGRSQPAMPVRAFVARCSYAASEAMWSGDENLAAKLMSTPVIQKTARASQGLTQADAQYARMVRTIRCTTFVKKRELTKKSDWATVK